jgi:hypothetical protein
MRKVIKEEEITFPEIQVFKSVSQTPKVVMEFFYLPSAGQIIFVECVGTLLTIAFNHDVR